MSDRLPPWVRRPVPVIEKRRELRIDKNERGQFECWEPDGCGPGKHALFLTVPTMPEAITTIFDTHHNCGLKLVALSNTQARFELK